MLIRTGATRRELATRWEMLAPDKAHRLVAERFAGRMAVKEDVMKAIASCREWKRRRRKVTDAAQVFQGKLEARDAVEEGC